MKPSSSIRNTLLSLIVALLLPIAILIFNSTVSAQTFSDPKLISTQSLFPGGLLATPIPTCVPSPSWVWTYGAQDPLAARQVHSALKQLGIDADVKANSYGETDGCGTFVRAGTDFTISLREPVGESTAARQALKQRIISIVTPFGKPNIGQIRITTSDGNPLILPSPTLESSTTPTTNQPRTATVINKKVQLLILNPQLSSGEDLITHFGWYSPTQLAAQIIDVFYSISHSELSYEIVYNDTLNDSWPILEDGFQYTEETYLAVMNGQNAPHSPDLANYNAILNTPALDICGKLNRGEIDELWMYGGPWFGFYESRLAGPGGYAYNSPPLIGGNTCNKLLPIMGLNYERGVGEAIHSFGHRMEATMTHAYGSWIQNRTSHNWERYALVKALSPNYSYSGCGNVHFPPNGVQDYDYDNGTIVLTNCQDFSNYPNLGDPLSVSQSITCSAWNCEHLGFLEYWFNHFPHYLGCAPDTLLNDWWQYIAAPALASNPSVTCVTPTPTPTLTFTPTYSSVITSITPTPPYCVLRTSSATSDRQLDVFGTGFPSTDHHLQFLKVVTGETSINFDLEVNWQNQNHASLDVARIKSSLWEDSKVTLRVRLSRFGNGTYPPISDWSPIFVLADDAAACGIANPTSTPTATVTPQPLPKPKLESPPSGAIITTTKVKLDWNDVTGATIYHVIIKQDSKNGNTTKDKNVATSQSRIKNLINGKTYFWRAQACTQYGCGKWSKWWNFTVQ